MAGRIKLDVIVADDGAFIVTDNLTTVYGVGQDFTEAVTDWAGSFGSQFEFLVESANRLGSDLNKQLLRQTQFFIDAGHLVEEDEVTEAISEAIAST